MSEMPMSGALTVSMWMRMPGQSWAGTAASFLAMWTAMMMAMMLPSLAPTLARYRRAMYRAGGTRVVGLTVRVGVGYFLVWTAVGAIVFPLGVALTELATQQPALARVAPVAAGAAVLFAGILQYTSWKARQLVVCRESLMHTHAPSRDARDAWRYGMRLGVHCVCSCAGLTSIMLVAGLMDVRVMAAITTAITIERLAPKDLRVVRTIGDAVVVAGLVLIARAVGLG